MVGNDYLDSPKEKRESGFFKLIEIFNSVQLMIIYFTKFDFPEQTCFWRVYKFAFLPGEVFLNSTNQLKQ
jgi:hypothetical protein